MGRSVSIALLGLIAASMAPPSPALGHPPLRVVAESGDDAPGADATFDELGSALLNEAGDVSFWARLDSTSFDDAILCRSQDGALTKIAREADPAVDLPGFDFLEPSAAPLDDDGGAYFHAPIEPGGGSNDDDEGLWRFDPDADVSLVVREGSPLPGTLEPIVEGANGPSPSAAGHLVLWDADGLWRRDPDGLVEMLVESGDPAPGAPLGARFHQMGRQFYGPGHALVDATGGVFFQASLEPGFGGITLQDQFGLWQVDPSGSVSLVARQQGDVPGIPGARFDLLDAIFAIGPSGGIAFFAALEPGPGGVTAMTRSGLWGPGPGGTVLIAQQGTSAPGTPGEFWSLTTGGESLRPFAVDVDGRVAFFAQLRQDVGGVSQDDDYGIWRSDGAGQLELVMREGESLPGRPGANAVSFADLWMVGDLLVLDVWYREAPDPAGRRALVAFPDEGAPSVWFAEGDPLEVAPGDVRTLLSYSVTSGWWGGRSLNESDELVAALAFSDASSAVVVVPEPGGALLLLAGALALAVARRIGAR